MSTARWGMRHRTGTLWMLASGALYLALALIYTYPLLLHLSDGVLRGLDTRDALEQTWVLAWVQHAVLTHNFHLFNAPIFYPTPGTFAYQDTIAPVAIALLPLSGIVHNPLVIYNIAVLLSYPLSGLAMYWLALYLCQDHRAAFLAGLIFAFCPYRVAHLAHLNLLSAEGIPLIILGFEAARRDGGPWRWAALGVAVLLCSTLSLYYLAFVLLGLALYSALLLLSRHAVVAPAAWRGIWALAAVLPLQIVLLVPYLRILATNGRQRTLQDVVYFSADVRDFLHAGPQSLLYGWTDALWRISALDVHQYLFTGWTALVLALLALSRRSHPIVVPDPARLYLAVSGILAVLMLGPYLRVFGTFTGIPLPYLIVFTFAPGYSGFRDIGRYDQVAMAFIAATAALGAARLFARMRAPSASRLLLVLATLMVLEYWTVQEPLYPVASGTAIPPVYPWLNTAPSGVVAELPMCGLPGAYCSEEATYMYYSTYHWHPLLNGGGGFFPPGWNAETAAIDRFPAPSAIAMLLHYRARYLVVHPTFPGIGAVRALIASGARTVGAGPYRLTVRRLGTDLVFVLPGGHAGG